jgi:dTDP-4-amino-4,6-dideoxygalactose transaminase
MIMNEPVPFNRPSMVGNEQIYIHQAFENMHISGDGPFTRKCHRFLEEALEVPRVLLTSSCTHALEMAALLLDIQPGDEVIVPAFTFVSTINAFVLRGARPRFADIRPDTLNLDEQKLEGLISPQTKAIVVVHYAGVGCEMDTILAIAQRHNIPVIEDNAHGLFGQYKGRHLGTFGCLATLSFHETKNITCGEGGALLINDPRYIERAEIIREKGTNRSRFFRGQVDKYTWVDVGSSFLPSDLQGAFLFAQLEQHQTIQRNRAAIWQCYREHLADWAGRHNVQLPYIPDTCAQAYHMFYMLMPTFEHRQAMLAHLKASGVNAVFHYLPLHLSPMGMSLGGKIGDCPVTESASERLLRLPFFNGITAQQQERVMAAVQAFNFEAVPAAAQHGKG